MAAVRKKTATKAKRKPVCKKNHRPRLYNAKAADRIMTLLRLGAPLDIAAAAAEISASTLDKWIATDNKTMRGFQDEVRKARAMCQVGLLSHVHKAVVRGEWRAGMALLAHANPKHFGPKVALSHSFERPTAVSITVSPTPQAATRMAGHEDF